VPDPQAPALALSVNGTLRRTGTTADMIFPRACLVEYLSQLMTSYPGDATDTGTPVVTGLGTRRRTFADS
jgi:2,4-didehydro-3-deoxy-L-rhamnonate hydrolase